MKGNKKYTTERFIEVSRSVHGDTYDYSHVELIAVNKPVRIVDPEHGDFWQRPNLHMNGAKSPWRANADKGSYKRLSTHQFVEKAIQVHGMMYDYGKTVYIRSLQKVEIIDPIYGSFWMTPNAHLCGQGHPQRGRDACDQKRRIGRDTFVSRAREKHGDLYDYSLVEYVNCDTKVRIIDPEHGEFEQTPYQHANVGSGHPKRPRRAEMDIDHILPMSLVVCAKDRNLRDAFHRDRPLVKLLQSDVNLRPLNPSENVSKYDYVTINGIKVRASSIRNNYDAIAFLVKTHLGIDAASVIAEDRMYLRSILGF